MSLSYRNLADAETVMLWWSEKENWMATANVQPLARPQMPEDHWAKARHAANIGDGPHTVLYTQEALCMAVEALSEDIAALRRELANRGG